MTQWTKRVHESTADYLTRRERGSVASFLEQLDQSCGEHVAQVIMFGSHARGDDELESDIDLLIVTRNGAAQVKEMVMHLTRDEPYLSVLVKSAEEYREHQRLRDPLYVNVRRDGIELWDPGRWLAEQQRIPLDFVEGELRTMDESTKETIRIYVGLARDALDDARYLRRGNRLRATNSKAYYAAHHVLVAALYALNVVRSKHSGVQAALSQFLVKPGHIEERYKDIYNELLAVREDSDYGPRFQPTVAQTDRLLAGAEQFVARMEAFLRDQGALRQGRAYGENDEEELVDDEE